MNAMASAPPGIRPCDDPRDPAYVDVIFDIPPPPEPIALSLIHQAQQHAADRSCARLLRTLAATKRPFEERLANAAARIAWERREGLRPMQRSVSMHKLQRYPATVMDEARLEGPVIVTNANEPVAVVVDVGWYTESLGAYHEWEAMKRASRLGEEQRGA